MEEDIIGSTQKKLVILWKRFRKNPFKTFCILFIMVVVIFFTSIFSGLGSKLASYFESTIPVLETIKPQSIVNNAPSINTFGQTGGTNNITVAPKPTPSLEIIKLSTSTKESDGVFRTNFILYVHNWSEDYDIFPNSYLVCDKLKESDKMNVIFTDRTDGVTPTVRVSCLSTSTIDMSDYRQLFQPRKK